jgi:hypothetical protein
LITATQFWILFPAFFIAIVGSLIYTRHRRLRFIDTYVWPPGLIAKLKRRHPTLTPSQIDRVGLGLKQFFRAYLRGNCRHVSMPSQAADDLWHEFILYTKAYDEFCQRAFGRFLHHTPAAILKPGENKTNEGLRRVWWQACKEERIDARAPSALPLLFSLDTDLNIANGYRYVPDCGSVRTIAVEVGYSRDAQCGSDFSSTSFDGGTDGLGDGDGGGDGGDGGGGCGGD